MIIGEGLIYEVPSVEDIPERRFSNLALAQHYAKQLWNSKNTGVSYLEFIGSIKIVTEANDT